MTVDLSLSQQLLATQTEPLRIGSFIVTVFGDTVVPRGGVLWLGSLIELLEHLSVAERRVRTAVYRLVQDDVLTNEQVGRRSFYRLTHRGGRNFREATQRIYTEHRSDWHGAWTLVLTGALDTEVRQIVRRELSWLGFGPFGVDVMAHPDPDHQALADHLADIGAREAVVAEAVPVADSRLEKLVHSAWNLDRVEAAYTQFLQRFEPLLAGAAKAHPADAFIARSLLIHEYRRALLRDPALPEALLPSDWHGRSAYALCAALYRSLLEASEHFVDTHFQAQTGPLPKPDKAFAERFPAT